MVSLSAALHCVKEDVSGVLSRESIEQACERQGHDWRPGPLDPANTVQLFVRQIVEGNVAGSEVVRLAGGGFTEPAWCQARQRLPLEVVRDLAAQVRDRIREGRDAGRADGDGGDDDGDDGDADPAYRWRGRRVFLADASNFSMPDTPALREYFGDVPGQEPGCGFPIAHWLAVFDLQTGVLVHDEASAFKTGDVNKTPAAHEALAEGDVVVGDDAFGGYAHLALLSGRKLYAVFPGHHARTMDFTPGRDGGPDAPEGRPKSRWVKSLGKDDQVVEYFKAKQRPKWLSKEQHDALPESLLVREIRRKVSRKGFRPVEVVVVTTLLDADAYPADEVVALRFRRWEVETDIRHLKTTMNMEVLRCQTPQGVLKELAVFTAVYNLTRAVMLESARRQKVKPTRLSFADALAWLCHAEDDHGWPALKVVPERPGRVEPRAVKRRPKPFDLMNKPRDEMRQRIKSKDKRK
jgi:hypothetical protein